MARGALTASPALTVSTGPTVSAALTTSARALEQKRHADQRTIDRAKQLLVFNQVSVVIALALGIYFYFGFVRSPWIIAGSAWLLVLLILITEGRRRLNVSNTVAVGIAMLLGNWITAVVITAVAPFTFAAGLYQVIIPVIAGGPVLEKRAVIKTVAGATVMTAIICLLGFGLDDGGVNPYVSERVQDLTMIFGMPVMTIAIGIGVWDAFERREDALRQERMANEQIRQSRQRLVAAADDERSRIERDLHDGAQQHLVAVAMRLRLLRSAHGIADEVDPLVDELEEALVSLRELAHGIYPPLLRSRGLNEAISAVSRRSAVKVIVDVADERYEPEVEACLYFCCLEAIQNAAKHGGDAAVVTVHISSDPQTVVGIVSDNGPGFDAETATWGAGLRNMDDRVGALSGEFTIGDANGADPRGTQLRFELPIAS